MSVSGNWNGSISLAIINEVETMRGAVGGRGQEPYVSASYHIAFWGAVNLGDIELLG